ncbi:MAG: hypothetical protein IKK11_03230, partial [Oscillospiraceae bacterium]|nr:hypothetical protein [Oscillospiraceae bacterium]
MFEGKKKRKLLSVLLVAMIVVSIVGCTKDSEISSEVSIPEISEEIISTPESSEILEEDVTQEGENETEQSIESEVPPVEIPVESEIDENGLTEQQRNSFSMLYYLAITAEDIRISKDNRLLLDDIYTSLLNDINPGAIDEITQEHLGDLRDNIKDFRNISIKRERLQYMYNQQKAAAIRSAIPNPLNILSITNAFDWKALVASVAYTLVDSYNNYKSADAAADQSFLMSGWELDDEETATIMRNRDRAFDYMVDITQEYGLDGKLTLSEKMIETFAEICEIESVQQKIRRLESEEETYKLLGNYWLELADCYYQTERYDKCLKCVDTYNALSTGIYRKDYNYAQILPKAIAAAQELYTGDEYVARIQAFADDIIENTNTDEWSSRYFAAQVYMDLYARTDDRTYLERAYNIAYDNVAVLLDEQRKLNAVYLVDVQEESVVEPDYDYMSDQEEKEAKKEYKAEKKRVKAYNKNLKKVRKTELPPLYEPLVLNCDLLFALADMMEISEQEKAEIEAILQTDTNGVFLSKPINDKYSFTENRYESNIEFDREKIIIPVELLTEGVEVVVSVTENGKTTTFKDYSIDE